VCKVAQVDNPQVQALEKELAKLRAENAKLREELAQYKKDAGEATAPQASTSAAAVAVEAPVKSLKDALRDGIAWPSPNEPKFWDRAPRSEPMPPLASPPGSVLSTERDSTPMHIVHITAEMAPIAKVGGLGDVVTGLARSCQARGHHTTVMMPFYESLPKDQIEGLKHEADIEVPKGYTWDGQMMNGSLKTSVYWGRIAGVPVYLIRPADWNTSNLFRGNRIYGGSYNEMEAYLYLCRACLEYLHVSGQQPHVLQLHDWHAAAAALLYWAVYHETGLWRPRVVLTIHNLDNTGECRQDEFAFTGVPGDWFAQIDKALDERTIGHNPERLNLMKGGIIYSNMITTVSPTYATEVMNGGAAGWLRSTFSREEIRAKFRGILNGIDAVEWDPASDPLLAANFTAQAPEGKALCKEFLQKGLGMNVDPNKPLVAVVSRLVPQKGIHLIKAAVYRTVQQGGQFVLLGSGHSDGVFKAMAAGEFKDHPDCRLMIMYSERLAHLIYAAADVVLVPSMFEPCGLTQMIALRYGAAPVVRRTGGLADTVRDVDAPAAAGGPPANGFVFDGTDDNCLYGALDRALSMYKNKPEAWTQLSLSNMAGDVSWAQSAKSYVELYRSIAQL